MLTRTLLFAGMLLLAILLTGCGGSGHGTDQLQQVSSPDSSSQPAMDLLPPLAELDGLDVALREISVLGPGWFAFFPEDYTAGMNSSVDSAGMTTFSNGAGNAWAMYRIGGFTSDFSPTSLHTHIDPAQSQPYYLLVADFELGRWRSAGPFSGDVSIELPGTDNGESHPFDFISPAGRFYCSVLMAGGAITDMKLELLELGIHGGVGAPRPPRSLQVSTYFLPASFDGGSVPSWNFSPDYDQPDFAGYIVERRNILELNYTEIGRVGPLETRIDIPGVRQTTGYRIAAYDVSGNRSSWAYTNDDSSVILLGDDIMQIRLKMPRGPLYGPVDVTFDMSDSYSPDGTAINEYKLLFDNTTLNYSGTDPVVTRTLQPGCYLITAEVSDGGGLGGTTGSTSRKLIVYPRWEAENIVVRNTDTSLPLDRFLFMNGGIDPLSGEETIVSFDATLPGLAIRRGFPGNYSLEALPQPDSVPSQFTDPAYFGGNLYFGMNFFSTPPALVTVQSDMSSIVKTSITDSWNQPLATDDGLFLIVGNPGSMRIINILNPGPPVFIVPPPLSNFRYMDAAWNPVSGLIEVAWADDAGLNWLSYDPLNGVLVDSSLGMSGSEIGVDIEIDPATGDSCILTRSSSLSSFLRRTGGSWSAPLEVDNTISNYWPADLKFLNGDPYAIFAGGTGGVQMYRLDAAGAVSVNTANYTTDGFYYGYFMPHPAGDSFIVHDRVASANVHTVRLFPNDTEIVLDDDQSFNPWGFWLDSAEGTDGLYLQMTNITHTSLQDLHSADGISWSEIDSVPGVSYADLSSTRSGEVYRTIRDGGGFDFSWWNGAAWDNRFVIPGVQINEALSAANLGGTTSSWLVHDSAANNLVRASGSAAGFTTMATVFPETTRIYKGVTGVTSTGIFNAVFCLYDKTAISQAFGLVSPYTGEVQYITYFGDSLGSGEDQAAFASELTTSRTMEFMPYKGPLELANNNGLACWAVNGLQGSALRYTFIHDNDLLAPPQLTELPLTSHNRTSIDQRRTVSAAQAYGMTAVALLSNIHGKHSYMEWSHFGDWEELALPDGVSGCSNGELLVDAAGRWYLFWRDIDSGQVLCRRSL